MTPSLVSTRYGAAPDLARIAALHDRCTPETILRRYHAPLPLASDRLLRRLAEPERGFSLLAEIGDSTVGMACAGPLSDRDLEVGVLVEDRHQGYGIGTRLLTEAADEAVRRGYERMLCLTQPDNDAVLASVARAGLRHRTLWEDGLMCVVIDVQSGTLPQRHDEERYKYLGAGTLA